jgi:hypothetical protein
MQWAWYNTVGMMLIGSSLASFYHLDNTPSFRGSIENDYFFVSCLLFIQMCRLFPGLESLDLARDNALFNLSFQFKTKWLGMH